MTTILETLPAHTIDLPKLCTKTLGNRKPEVLPWGLRFLAGSEIEAYRLAYCYRANVHGVGVRVAEAAGFDVAVWNATAQELGARFSADDAALRASYRYEAEIVHWGLLFLADNEIDAHRLGSVFRSEYGFEIRFAPNVQKYRVTIFNEKARQMRIGLHA